MLPQTFSCEPNPAAVIGVGWCSGTLYEPGGGAAMAAVPPTSARQAPASRPTASGALRRLMMVLSMWARSPETWSLAAAEAAADEHRRERRTNRRAGTPVTVSYF